MNLMFRKNFREQKSGIIAGKGSKGTVGRHTSKRCSREQGYTAMEEHHYRTHLFFSPPRCSYSQEDDEIPGSPGNDVLMKSARLYEGLSDLF